MKSVLVRIQEYSAQASGAEKGVLRFLRENPEEAAGYSIKQLADKTFSSAATIVRLCRKMGFEGYKSCRNRCCMSQPCAGRVHGPWSRR